MKDVLFSPGDLPDVLDVVGDALQGRLAIRGNEERSEVDHHDAVDLALLPVARPVLLLRAEALEDLHVDHKRPVSKSLTYEEGEKGACLIRDVPADVVHCAGGGVRPDDGRLGERHGLERGCVGRVGEVHEHAEPVELVYELAAELPM